MSAQRLQNIVETVYPLGTSEAEGLHHKTLLYLYKPGCDENVVAHGVDCAQYHVAGSCDLPDLDGHTFIHQSGILQFMLPGQGCELIPFYHKNVGSIKYHILNKFRCGGSDLFIQLLAIYLKVEKSDTGRLCFCPSHGNKEKEQQKNEATYLS